MNRWTIFVALIALFGCAALLPAEAAGEICILVTDSQSQRWNGEFGAPFCDPDSIDGLEFHHLVERDAVQARHQQAIFSKWVDATSINFWSAFGSGETLERVELQFWDTSAQATIFHTIRLEDVVVESIELLDVDPGDGSDRRATERIRLSYRLLTISKGTREAVLQNNRS